MIISIGDLTFLPQGTHVWHEPDADTELRLYVRYSGDLRWAATCLGVHCTGPVCGGTLRDLIETLKKVARSGYAAALRLEAQAADLAYDSRKDFNLADRRIVAAVRLQEGLGVHEDAS